MPTFVYRNGKLVNKQKAVPRAGAFVISDEMAPTRHMADCKMYTSKAKFRQATRAAGCVEVGTDQGFMKPRAPIQLDRGARREAIRKTIYELRNR